MSLTLSSIPPPQILGSSGPHAAHIPLLMFCLKNHTRPTKLRKTFLEIVTRNFEQMFRKHKDLVIKIKIN